MVGVELLEVEAVAEAQKKTDGVALGVLLALEHGKGDRDGKGETVPLALVLGVLLPLEQAV